MTKEEKIKEAYGEYWEGLKKVIDIDGWVDLKSKNISNDLANDMIGVFRYKIEVDYKFNHIARPKSLQGIENNNGWIKINSEDDLPKEGTYCHFIIKGFEELHNQGLYDGMFWDNKCAYISSIVTHYQPIQKPIQKPTPPLY